LFSRWHVFGLMQRSATIALLFAFAVQIAKWIGATVIAVVSSAEKSDVCKQYGADHCVISGSEIAWYEHVLRLTDGRGADVIFDPVGLSLEATKCTAWNGRLVVIGFAGGTIPSLPLNRVLLKNMSVRSMLAMY
jgi:NADPH:quinone reductase-like Zn-dependent oxidoreductase